MEARDQSYTPPGEEIMVIYWPGSMVISTGGLDEMAKIKNF
jgi:hypothetical protein